MKIKEILTNPTIVFFIGGLMFGFGLISLYYKKSITVFVLITLGVILFVLGKRREKHLLESNHQKILIEDKYKVKGQWK